VRYLKTIWIVGLALLWVPITAHCKLEIIPALSEILACCDHEEQSAPHQDDDCEQDGCAAVESGKYRTQDLDALVVAPDFTPIDLPGAALEPGALPDEVSLGIFTTAPPPGERIWNFSLRTALPARAPSLAS
jgi:hypothetical protein